MEIMDLVTGAGGFLATYWLMRVDKKIDRLFELRDGDAPKLEKTIARVEGLERTVYGKAQP